MTFSINFNQEKNQMLKATRGLCFEDIIEVIRQQKFIADISHPNPKLKHQKIYIVEILGYAYAVPYVLDKTKKEIFLKTIYPSRELTKKYLKRKSNEKQKI